MPVRHPILNGMGRLGLGEVAAKMIDASVDAISKPEDDAQAQALKEQFERQTATYHAAAVTIPKRARVIVGGINNNI